jgi:hypothetical protein
MSELSGRHWRALIGLMMMAFGIGAYGLVLFHIGAPVETCALSWVHVVRQYGFPALLLIGGYNLFQKTALGEIAAAFKLGHSK